MSMITAKVDSQKTITQSRSTPPPSHLLSKKALALSLSAPRAPPYQGAHRRVLLGKDPGKADWIHSYRVKDFDGAPSIKSNATTKPSGTTNTIGVDDDDINEGEPAHSLYPHETLRQRLRDRFVRAHRENTSVPRYRGPHPHVPSGPELGDRVTRFLGSWLPHTSTNHLRDEGYFQSICDTLVTATVPLMGITHPRMAKQFLELTRTRQRMVYGTKGQYVDVYLPEQQQQQQQQPPTTTTTTSSPSPPSLTGRLVCFVHGGAWGSGLPWMYRLCAVPFLQQGWAVAIPSYRVYPHGKAPEQVQDIQAALTFFQERFPRCCEHVTLMGHSSGAHIGLLYLAERVQEILVKRTDPNSFPRVDAFVGLSGPYDISHHFDYEAARGVEELSPMKAACGMTRQGFRRYSPALYLLDGLASVSSEQFISALFPSRILLLHSVEDATVPFTSTGEAARILRSCGVTQCQELYIGPGTAHQDTALELMVGGPTRDAVVDWMQEHAHDDATPDHAPARLHKSSKL